MKKLLKDGALPAFLLTMKLMVTLRTGLDTYSVSNDLLDVLIIDGAYLVFWMVAAYGGTTEQWARLRRFSVAGAWLLYVSMIVIGLEAHWNFVSVVARVGGGLLLAYETSDVLWQWADAWKKRPAPDVLAYGRVLLQNEFRRGMQTAVQQSKTDIDKGLLEVVRELLPQLFADVREGVVVIPRTSAVETRSTVVERWNAAVSAGLPARFSREDFEELAGCKRTAASEAIAYAVSAGDAIKAGNGTYVLIGRGNGIREISAE